MTAKRLYLIDGSGYIFRAFHALPPMTRADGTPVNAVYGYSSMLLKLLDDLREHGSDELIAVVFDAKRTTFRNAIYKLYKAQRPEPPEELKPQFAIIRDATRAFNIPCVEMEGFEADDLIATYARLARARDIDVCIISADKDLMQLIRPGVSMRDPIKNRDIGPAQVMEKFGVGPDKVVEVQALAGDSSDNIPGVPGIGVKTAAELILKYGDVETLLRSTAEIKQPKRRENLEKHAELALLSKQLVTLQDQVPLEVGLDQLHWKQPDPEVLLKFVMEQGFKSLIPRVAAKIAADGVKEQAAIDFQKRVGERPTGPTTTTAPTHAPDKSGAVDRSRYETIQTVQALQNWMRRAQDSGWMAVDTETDGLDQMQAKLVGISLSVEVGSGAYIPLRHVGTKAQGTLDLDATATDAPPQIPVADAIRILKPILEDASILKIGHNIKFDMHVLSREGINVAPVDDTMVMCYVLEASPNVRHGMDDAVQRHLNHKTITYEEVCGTGKNQITFDRAPLDKATAYAAEDADVTRRLYARLRPRLVNERLVSVYETMDRPLIPVLREMERKGVLVDPGVLDGLSKDFAKRMADLETEIHKLAGGPFNIASPKQLGEILFERMSLPGGRKTKTGAYGTDADVLEDLAAQGHDLPARVLDWRQLSKLKSTYTDALAKVINPATRRVHTCFAQTIASTGRLSSVDPNLQNIPIRTEDGRKIRQAFVAPKGRTLLSADYSQIELRLVAHVADVKRLKQAFKNGEDIHAATASEMFNVPIEGMDPMIRRSAKAINFGIIYGISGFGLARQLGIARGEAQSYIEAYFAKFPEIRQYMEETKAGARRQGFVTTLFGRKIFTPGINDKNPNMRGFAERAAINAPIQGGAADIIKRAMIRLPDALVTAGLETDMLLQVHDELVFEVPDGELDAAKPVIKKVMEGAAHLSVPLTVDMGTGHNWAEAH
ncbi:MAG: DNA polymerase I [Rhodospirillaceae bacterium]